MTNLALNQNTYTASQTNFSNIRRTPARACKKLYVRPSVDENIPVIKFPKGKGKSVKILERQNATRKIPLSKCVKDEEICELTKHMEKLDVKFDSSVPSKKRALKKSRSRRDIATNKNRRSIIPVDALPMSIPKMDNEIIEEINKELSETWRQKKGGIKNKAGRRPLKENVSTQNRRVSFINEDAIMKHKGKQRQKGSEENLEINI
ncbi:hypothetical protein CEXT_723501 [Caerostris extrusa]|uniref:Uncharacterized protein n=1 Tax=Caerostris extrusa TaxID=172846 RepID=A0AAV4QKA2_CAEEX|nr:hypothetical protein CEXT_723501 [Caerostris extrusa]